MSLQKERFLCGVCEGFYGRPWTTEQRMELFKRMRKMELNVYMYAPKDDYKHRQFWRDLYTQEEQDELKQLIDLAKENNVTFVYALSPGLDMVYSSDKEMQILKDKLDQMSRLGCEAYALLYDDIEPHLCEEDSLVFDSFAHAHSHVTNEIYHYLGEPSVFLFCPTEYCASRAEPTLASSDYLHVVGEKLEAGIDIFWTGPKIVSRNITVESIEDLVTVIKRKPVIWDNLHANDYDQTRLYLGPYEGRSLELRNHLNGILTNPNCEFEANFIAMHTLGSWNKCAVSVQDRDSKLSDGPMLNPKEMLRKAVTEWLPYFYQDKSSTDDVKQSPDTPSTSDNVNDCSMKEQDKCQDSSSAHKDVDKDMLTGDNLMLMADLFYLPYDNGSGAVNIIKEVHWLIENAKTLPSKSDDANLSEDEVQDNDENVSPQTREILHWFQRKEYFTVLFKDVVSLVDKLANIPNRALLYDIYPYVVDMRSVLGMLNSYIRWISDPDNENKVWRSGEQEAGFYRSGLYAELRRMLPFDGRSDMHPPPKTFPPVNATYIIRPYFQSDKESLYRFCLQTCDEGEDGSDLYPDHPDVISHKLIGGFLELSPSLCYIVEDDIGICGYAVATPDIKKFIQQQNATWLPKLCKLYPQPYSKYPKLEEEIVREFHEQSWNIPDKLLEDYDAFMHIVIDQRVSDRQTPKRLFQCVLKVLKAADACGVMTAVHMHSPEHYSFCRELGFTAVKGLSASSMDTSYLGYKICSKKK